jgi:hypothetical protein
MTEYKEFEDWFLEIENYGTRAERFYESLESFQSEMGRTANGIVWLKAAFEAGKSGRSE